MLRYEHGGYSGVYLDFSVNVNPLGMPESVISKLSGNISRYSDYPDNDCNELRLKLAEKNNISPDMILCGNGASELIMAVCASLKPKRIVTLSPTFSEYERCSRLFGAEVYYHSLKEEKNFILSESILNLLTFDKDILFLCNPNNPTGQLADPFLLKRIIKHCYENGIIIVLDECFIEFTDGESLLSYTYKFPNLLILNAFTKIYSMAGIRLGTLYCSDKKLLHKTAEFCPAWHVSAVAQAAGSAALDESGWLEKTRALIRQEREFLSSGLEKLGLKVYPSDTNFILIKSELPLYKLLLNKKISVRSCDNFAGLDGFIRIGLKTHNENKALLAAVSEVLHG